MYQTTKPTIPSGLMRPLLELKEKRIFDQENGGQYFPGETTTIPFQGAVLPIGDKDLQYGQTGTFTKDSYKIYTNGHKLEAGMKVRDPTDKAIYTVKQELGYNSIHTLRRYVVERKEPSKNDIY